MDVELSLVTEHQPDADLQHRCESVASSDELINLLGATDVMTSTTGSGKTELTYHLDVMDRDAIQLIERLAEAYVRLMVYPALIRVTTRHEIID